MQTTSPQTKPAEGTQSAVKFGPSIRGVVIDNAISALIGKRVRVTLSPDQVIVGKLGRNSFSNNTLCITTGNSDEQLYGKFFFEPASARGICEIL